MRRIVGIGVVAVIVVVTSAACGEDTPSIEAADGSSATELSGTTWELATVAGEAVPSVGASWITFVSDGSVNGSGGCNVMTGSWVEEGEELSIGPLGTTLQLCPESDLEEQEAQFVASLDAATRYAMADGALQLFAGSEELATLDSVDRSEGIVGAWAVVMYNDGNGVVSLVPGTELTADFSPDGTVSGSSGCNAYTGTYTVDGELVEVGPVAQTERACIEPEGAMDQEMGYLGALQSVASWSIQGATLELRAADDTLAVVLEVPTAG